MSDPLDRAVDARLDAYRPDTVPPFTAIEARKRRRDRRRVAGTGVLSVVAVAGAALLVPSLTGGGDRLTPDRDARVYAGPGAGAEGPVQRFAVHYDVAAADSDPEYREPEVKACLALPGVLEVSGFTSLPPARTVDVAGSQADRFVDCVRAVPGLRVTAVPGPDEQPASGFPWTGARICADIPDEQCRTVDAETARAVDTLLLAAETAPPGAVYCQALSTVYRITFQHPSARPAPVSVPYLCGPMTRGGQDYLLDQAARDAVKAAFDGGSPEPKSTPDDDTDCRALRPGDTFDVQNLRCDGGDDIRVETMDCKAGVYVYLARDGLDDLEGLTGITPTWLRAEPRDPSTGRTPFAFENCKEHG